MLQQLFSPRSIAIIGASRTKGKIGHDILKNTIQFGFKGKVYPVNPKAKKIAGLKCYQSITQTPTVPDVAVIVVPAPFVERVLEECGQAGVPFAVVISAGFKETGAQGAKAEKQLKKTAAKYSIRLVGPNCLGFLNAHKKLNASFAEGMPKKGNISLVSQSGAMGVALLDWAYETNVGFSNIISIGNKADINEVDCLRYFATDKNTEVIMMYVESITDGHGFLEAAADVAQKKPLIVLKAGVSERAKKAVSSHTGSLAGSEEAFTAALKKVGAVHVRSVEEFFDAGLAFSQSPNIRGKNIAIVTNAGGPGILATDAAKDTQLSIRDPKPQTKRRLQKGLPEAASVKNPVDVLGDATSERYEHALTTLAKDTEVDGIITILTPQVMTDEDRVAHVVAKTVKTTQTPIFTTFIGGKKVHSAREIFEHTHIPHFDTPERAVRAMNHLITWYTQKLQLPTKWTAKPKPLPNAQWYAQIRTTEAEHVLAAQLKNTDVRVEKSRLMTRPQDCHRLTRFPLVMKIASRDVIHKKAAGGIVLNIQSQDEARKAYKAIRSQIARNQPKAEIEGMLVQQQLERTHKTREVIVGMKRDPSFGPLVMVGLGGSMVEVLHDVAFGVAPVSMPEAKNMIQSLQAVSLLEGCDMHALAQVIVAVGKIGLAYPEIQELDINPLILEKGQKGGHIVDVRILI